MPDALARAETWRPEDEMTLQRVCTPQSIVYSVQGPFPFEVDQTGDVIVFRYEYYDQVRSIIEQSTHADHVVLMNLQLLPLAAKGG